MPFKRSLGIPNSIFKTLPGLVKHRCKIVGDSYTSPLTTVSMSSSFFAAIAPQRGSGALVHALNVVFMAIGPEIVPINRTCCSDGTHRWEPSEALCRPPSNPLLRHPVILEPVSCKLGVTPCIQLSLFGGSIMYLAPLPYSCVRYNRLHWLWLRCRAGEVQTPSSPRFVKTGVSIMLPTSAPRNDRAAQHCG